MREFNTEMERMNREASTGFSAAGAGETINANINKRLQALDKERVAAEHLAEIYSGTAVLNVKYARDAARIADEQKALELLRIGVIKQRGEVEKKAAVDSDANFQKQKDAALQLEAVRVAGELATLKGVEKIRATWRQYYDDQVSKGVDASVAQASAQRQATAEIAKYLVEQKQKHKEVTDRIVEFWLRVKGAQIDSAKDAADQSIEQLDKITDAMVDDFKKEGEARSRPTKTSSRACTISARSKRRRRSRGRKRWATRSRRSCSTRTCAAMTRWRTCRSCSAQRRRPLEARAALNEQTNLKIVQENRQMVNTLGDQLVSIWDDIASGNIGKTILNLVKKLVAQIVAQFLLGFAGIRNAFAAGQQNGGGLLGGLLSKLFNFGGSSSSGGGFSLPGMGGLPGSGSGGGVLNMFGSGGFFSNLFGSGGGSSSGGGFAVGLGGPPIIGSGGGLIGSGVTPSIGGSGGGFSLASLGGLAGGALTLGFGLLLGNAIQGAFGPDPEALKIQAQYAQLAQQDASYNKPIRDLVAGYRGYSVDFASASAQLHSMGGQLAGEQLQKITAIEAERQRRRDIPFGLPQFLSGGEYRAPRAGGAGFAILHDQEVVMNPGASRRNRPLLDSLNAGGSAPSGGTTNIYQISAWDGDSVDRWLRAGGASQLESGRARMQREYRGKAGA
jgi:hypothetical protein